MDNGSPAEWATLIFCFACLCFGIYTLGEASQRLRDRINDKAERGTIITAWERVTVLAITSCGLLAASVLCALLVLTPPPPETPTGEVESAARYWLVVLFAPLLLTIIGSLGLIAVTKWSFVIRLNRYFSSEDAPRSAGNHPNQRESDVGRQPTSIRSRTNHPGQRATDRGPVRDDRRATDVSDVTESEED